MEGSKTHRTPDGFTLIELLVVIAIISILAAILFPAFAKAREKARQSACASNEKQMGYGIMQYAQDFDEQLPGSSNYDQSHAPAGSYAYSWRTLIYPYVRSVQLYGCPSNSFSSKFPGTNTANSDYLSPGPFPIGYGANPNAIWPANTPTMPVGKILLPAQFIVVGESLEYYGSLVVNRSAPTDGVSAGMFSSHNGGANYIFADGHTRWLLPSQTLATGVTVGNPDPSNMWLNEALSSTNPDRANFSNGPMSTDHAAWVGYMSTLQGDTQP
jgi:prepilin-type N-terminal cleavage/methylation domain-containing protein/prepilin-type processing-associated H-X9-DG protein